tara:strand:+ start:1347 stop:2039 length:693 start_codon:yes stop_codon:yes gene_type:complete
MRYDLDTIPEVRIQYYGHSCFLLSFNNGFRILIDPYRNRYDRIWFAKLLPQINCDLCLITHAHFDHDEVNILEETSSILRVPGILKTNSLTVHGFQDIHAGRSGKLNFPNIIYKIETSDMSFVHWGDNRPNIPRNIHDSISNPDVLFLPSDDTRHLLSFEEIEELIITIKPKIVIPMHYFIEGISHNQNSLLNITEWLESRNEPKMNVPGRININKTAIPDNTEIWIMNC